MNKRDINKIKKLIESCCRVAQGEGCIDLKEWGFIDENLDELIDFYKNKSDYEERIRELQQENSDFKKYTERMDKPKVQVIDGEIALDNIKYKQALEDVREIT